MQTKRIDFYMHPFNVTHSLSYMTCDVSFLSHIVQFSICIFSNVYQTWTVDFPR